MDISSTKLLGFGVGAFSAVMPQAILAVTPPDQTAASMIVNQVVRSVGFPVGSAVSRLILAAHTAVGAFAPAESGYSTAAWTAGSQMWPHRSMLPAGIIEQTRWF
ncbi:hypothetical protein [Gordonia sp. (in: high G+C Gram-positive bacteria)]|uniref:hypothetical protein n=1 Tax=Gordonia sp. (in: high G+C Gram-positive bacteria) TaxID=84139 RepID=UPI003C71AA1C